MCLYSSTNFKLDLPVRRGAEPPRGDRNWSYWQELGQFIMFLLCCSYLFMLFPGFSLGSLPQDTALHKLCSYVGLSHRQPLRTALMWILSRGYSSLGTDCSRMGYSQTTVLARSLLWRRLSMGCSFIQGTSACLLVGTSTCWRMDICSAVALCGLQGDYVLHDDLRGLQQNLCSST